MTARRIVIAAALMTGLAACPGPDQTNEQVQADNIAAQPEATAGGTMGNPSSANASAANEPAAEGEVTSGMPIVNHPEVNEHLAYNDQAAPDR